MDEVLEDRARSNGVLNSWKEIACYLDRGVRTVQRWERDLQLPVQRLGSGRRGAVRARCQDIDDWLSHCPRHVLGGE